jgi:hypothetical protein
MAMDDPKKKVKMFNYVGGDYLGEIMEDVVVAVKINEITCANEVTVNCTLDVGYYFETVKVCPTEGQYSRRYDVLKMRIA